MGLLLRRCFLPVLCFFSLLSVSEGAWTDVFQKGLMPAEKPKVEKEVCLVCHDSDLIKPEYRAIPAQWRQSVHYANGVSCSDCHGGDPKDAAKSMLPASGFVGTPKYKDVPEFCGKCHIGIMQNYLESGHGKALKATGKGPNCVTCHGSHNIHKADIDIINEKLCTTCHSYERAKAIKASLLLTEMKIRKINNDIKTLKAGLIPTADDEKVMFRTEAEYRTLFHTVDVNLVKAKTEEFNQRLSAIDVGVEKGFRELRFRQNFAILIMLIFIGLAINIFLLGRKSE